MVLGCVSVFEIILARHNGRPLQQFLPGQIFIRKVARFMHMGVSGRIASGHSDSIRCAFSNTAAINDTLYV